MVVGDPIIFKNEFVTQTSNIEASEKVDVCCKIFQPMKWIEHVDKTFSTEKLVMSKDRLEFKLIDTRSSYEPENDYFSIQSDMSPLSYQNLFILSSKIISYQDDILINSSDETLMLFESKDDLCGVYDGISDNGNINPNKFDVVYRVFNLVEKDTLNLKLPGPPELSRKGGSFIVHQPDKNLIGLNKWKFGSISIESIVIRKIEDSFEINFNLENKNFLSTIPIIEVKGKDWSQKSEPILPENRNFRSC